ncbi:B2L14 protein, partial [Pluvianellus socialis]|nr:B2L14 protein [Pluvianellus socialis]
GTKMSSPNDASVEEIPLQDDERDSVEYRILMAYAQRRLSVSKYRKLLKNDAKVQKSSSIRRKAEIDHQRDKDRPRHKVVKQGGVVEMHGKKQSKRKHLPGYCLPFYCSTAEQEESPASSSHHGHMEDVFVFQSPKPVPQGNFHNQTSEAADVNHIADKLAKLVASRSHESPSDVSFKIMLQGPREKQDKSYPTDETEGEEHDEEKIIQKIVSLLKQSGDRLEEKIKKDRGFNQHFKDMLSYNFFSRITDLFLQDVSAVSPSEPGGQVQCMKVALTMEVATRLTAVDNHPMNLVLGFGLKYLREHFKPWIQEQGGW